MSILQLISSAGLYGAENMLISLAKSLNARGCHNVVGVFHNSHRPNGEVGNLAQLQGLPVEMIPCRGRADWGAVRAVRNCIRAHGVDLVHTHGYKADLYGYAAARSLRTPLVATCHNWTRQTISLRLHAFLDHLVLRHFHQIVAVSDHVATSLRHLGAPHDRITRIDNGIDFSAFEAAPPTLAVEIRKGERMVVGAVGRLVPQKGFQYFLRAAREILKDFPDTLFVLVGDGPGRKMLEGLAREMRLERNLIIAGQRRDMPGVIASIDIFVLPSLNEGIPMSILEALAAKKPVVATRVGAVSRVIVPERTGLLVEPGDTAGLRTAILRLLGDRELRRELGDNGQAWVRQHFAVDAMAQSYLDLYQRLVKGRAAA